MGSSKKSKDKDKDKSREHKKKRRKSRSRSRDKKHRRHRERDDRRDDRRDDHPRDRSRERSREKDSKRRKDYGYDEPFGNAYDRQAQAVEIPGLGEPYAYAEAAASNDQYQYGHMEDGELPGNEEIKEEKPTVSVMGSSSAASGGGNESLSIDETNALRAKIGLKPLEVNEDGSAKAKKEDVHVPAVNISQVKKQDDLKMKLMAVKEKRRINAMLGKVKTLGAESDDDDVGSWVKKMRKVDNERKIADKRAKLMDELDNEFGIGDIVEEAYGAKKKYTSRDLAGLKVQHSGTSFKEGRTVILTLEDQGVLDDGEEKLINVNMVDDEKYVKNVENKKKKPDYKAYDDDEMDEYGMMQKKDILNKYDEEIDGEKKEGFVLKSGGRYVGSKEKIREEMRVQAQQHRIALSVPAPTLATEFYTEEEMTSFKKVKRKVRKIRKKPKVLKADDLLPMEDPRQKPIDAELSHLVGKSGSIPGLDFVGKNPIKKEEDEEEDADVDGPEEDLTGTVIDDEAANELQIALEKTRKLKQNQKAVDADKRVANDILQQKQMAEEEDSDSDGAAEQIKHANIVLNQTSEFCRTLGDIPTYGQAGNRLEEEEEEMMDYEQEKQTEEPEDANNPGWQEVDIADNPIKADIEERAVLDDEPVVGSGVAAALNLATKKGYLGEEQQKQPSAKRVSSIDSVNYSIEDKRYDDLDDKYRKRERYAGGMVSEFSEKDGYKPNVKLDYVDDTGRLMSQKEAFRYLSHSFHGKGSGKMKTEKRKKKIEEEQLMKSMSSTDTPLGTAAMLEDKLSRQKTPYLVLSGGNKALTTDRISK